MAHKRIANRRSTELRGPDLRQPVALRLAGVVAACWLAGCVPPAKNLFDPSQPLPAAPSVFNDRDWATVLRENVKDGLVDYEHLSTHAEPLDGFLSTVASSGPQSTPELYPSPRARLAYYLNAYNAAVLKAVLVEGIPDTMHDPRRPQLDYGYNLLADGMVQTLADLRAAARAQAGGDARIELCLSDAALGSPPLFGQPFRADRLDEQLRRVAREAMDSPRMVTIDHERQRLNVSVVIEQNRRGLVDLHRRQTGAHSGTMLAALLHMASKTRREWLNAAVGYELGKIPFDRALNRWSAEKTGSKDGR
jgi:hypothetical protein